MNKKYFAIISLIILAIIGSVIYVQVSRTVIQGESPVETLEFYKHWITVNPESGAELQEFVDIDLFHSFQSGNTFDKTIEIYGEPDNIREERFNIYYEYSFDDTRIEVGREEYADGDDIGVAWSLYSYPYNKNYQDILAPQISKYVNPRRDKTTIIIKGQDDRVNVLVNVVGSRVDQMIFY